MTYNFFEFRAINKAEKCLISVSIKTGGLKYQLPDVPSVIHNFLTKFIIFYQQIIKIFLF